MSRRRRPAVRVRVDDWRNDWMQVSLVLLRPVEAARRERVDQQVRHARQRAARRSR